ncbi:MAG: KAP family P-loop domain protein [bacterium ADurb.Bin212]|nr:MAG: KAP family P-loop domain protein [bacterium ADurb.Bin212]
MPDILIPIDTVQENFKLFLDTENNSRIFFSGKFGIGKTYFLKEFFDSNTDNYEVFHLFPVNYEISNNEDIIELIKYDILIELLDKNNDILTTKKIQGIKDSALLFFSWYRKSNSLNSILQSTLSTLDTLPNPIFGISGKLGRPLKSLLKMDKEYQDFKKEFEKGEKGLAEKYIEKLKEKDISEEDYISNLLRDKIIQQKGNKKSVLVLDDLDRIDPEHIFRILNILSAYFEKEHENKFGFDSVIIVGDYSNLKHVFHHKYGPDADFSGYIDKFFSIAPYYFDNKKALLDTVDNIIKSFKCEDQSLTGAFGHSGYINLFLKDIYERAIGCGIINLRELLKGSRYQLTELKKGGYYEEAFSDNAQKIFDIAVKIAIHSFSNMDTLSGKLVKIKHYDLKRDNRRIPYEYYISIMLRPLGLNIPDEETILASWRNYKYRKENRFGVKIEGNQEKEMFYDMLIEYINQRKHIKYDSWAYER